MHEDDAVPRKGRKHSGGDGTDGPAQAGPVDEVLTVRSAPGAKVSLFTGLGGVCLAFIPLANVVAFVPGIVAVVFGVRALRACSQEPLLKGRGLAVAGVVLGGLVVVYTLVLLYLLFFVIGWGEFLEELRRLQGFAL